MGAAEYKARISHVSYSRAWALESIGTVEVISIYTLRTVIEILFRELK